MGVKDLILETSIEPYCGRLRLESEGFFSKIQLTAGVAAAFTEFLKKTFISGYGILGFGFLRRPTA